MATPHIAFDPLDAASFNAPVADSSADSFNSDNLRSELRLSLESSLDALAHADAATVESDETENVGEQFDLDEIPVNEEDVIASPQSEKEFSFNLRNVVLACGVVLGSLILLWIHGLVSPVLDSSDAGATRAGTPGLVKIHAPENSGSQTANPPAPEPQLATPPSTMATSNNLFARASSAADEQATDATNANESAVETNAAITLNSVQPHAASSSPSAIAILPEQRQEQSQGKPSATLSVASNQSQQDTAASSNGTPFNPVHSSAAATPVVGLPSVDNALPLLPPGVKPETGRQRQQGRPRGAKGNAQPGSVVPDSSARMLWRNMKEKGGQATSSPSQDGRLRAAK